MSLDLSRGLPSGLSVNRGDEMDFFLVRACIISLSFSCSISNPKNRALDKIPISTGNTNTTEIAL